MDDREQVDERPQVRRQRDDPPDVEVARRPAVEPATDARRERVIDIRMAESTRDADRAQLLATIVEEAPDPDDRIELKQRKRGGRAGEVDAAIEDVRAKLRRQGVDVYLETQRQGLLGAQARSDTAIAASGDRLVQSQPVAPEGLIAERVESEDLPAAVQNPLRRRVDQLIDR